MFEIHVPAAYYCSDGCGGGLSDDANGTIYYYNYGECIAQDTCMYVTINVFPIHTWHLENLLML